MKNLLFGIVFFCFLIGVICFGFGYMRTGAYCFEDPVFSMFSYVFFGVGIGFLLLYLINEEAIES